MSAFQRPVLGRQWQQQRGDTGPDHQKHGKKHFLFLPLLFYFQFYDNNSISSGIPSSPSPAYMLNVFVKKMYELQMFKARLLSQTCEFAEPSEPGAREALRCLRSPCTECQSRMPICNAAHWCRFLYSEEEASLSLAVLPAGILPFLQHNMSVPLLILEVFHIAALCIFG